MAWNFALQRPKAHTETALDACAYFLDETLKTKESCGNRQEILSLEHKKLRLAVVQGDSTAVAVLLEALGDEKSIVVNMEPLSTGVYSLLFEACQSGYEDIAQVLIEAGANGTSHPVTNYTPLYAAVHRGSYEITKLILQSFPELIQQATVERWLPLQVACINGHIAILELLLNFEFPDRIFATYRNKDDTLEWRMPFDPNHQDITGQTALYIACILGKIALVSMLLNWKVKAQTICQTEKTLQLTPTKNRDTDIQAILSKFHICEENQNSMVDMCPINLDILCGAARETALLAAVRGGFLDVATLLLQSGANPNIVARPLEDQNDPKCSEEIYGLCNTPLAEATKQKSTQMMDLLLRFGAEDEQGAALSIAMASNDESLISKLLAMKAYPDNDYKINKRDFSYKNEKEHFIPSTESISYGAIFPKVATIINWHNKNVQLPYIRLSWIIRCVLELNSKLNLHPKSERLALMAVTRIDLSHNSITHLPVEIFSMLSLKYLNVAQNKLQTLPVLPSSEVPMSSDVYEYDCPVLEEVYLQDNRLVLVPRELFLLPSLVTLDLSNNKLQDLPFEMWNSPKLRDLNVSFNLLRELPSPASEKIQEERASVSSVSYGLPFSSRNCCGNYMKTNMVKCSVFHQNIWSTHLEIIENDTALSECRNEDNGSQIASINLANNLLAKVPACLPCLATKLVRLNISYNSLRSMGHVTSYPVTLKQLDLSHNEITCWPSLPRVTKADPYLCCYSLLKKNIAEFQMNQHNKDDDCAKNGENTTSDSFRASVIKNACWHRKHLRLEALRTLLLGDNLLTRIQLSTDDITMFNEYEDPDWNIVGISKTKIIFPNLSMLDVSNNCIKEVPAALHELSSLSVLNISGNVDISDLPPQLGLLSRLWNLNTRGCALQEPLRSMVENKKYKTMDIIGYLKSIFEDAQPYTRMKLMIVGVQGIGKTTLLNLLKNDGSNKGRTIDHWAKRMGHKDNSKSKLSINISTVGVDIGSWTCDKRGKNNYSSYGPVTFRTWDFGGQKEYYATHQYFISKRSIYLVLWKITDGEKGLEEILQWLGNIQARAPNSPVIIVGTHYDAISDTKSADKAAAMQQIIREKFIAIPDAEKIGLPRVIDSLEISCLTLHNIRNLSNTIYDTAFILKSPGCKEPLLLQKIPASYVALEEVVGSIVQKLKQQRSDPVLNSENYQKLVTEEMCMHNYKGFRDYAELNQASMFLHDNGVILHYDDAILRDFYFLDPQWLCDMLAHVVTVPEINPFARKGIMKLDDLYFLFRNEKERPGLQKYIINLLNKFEVALTWDTRALLIPSLLPDDEELDTTKAVTVHALLKVKSKLDSMTNMSLTCQLTVASSTDRVSLLRRVLLMTYFPSGFWSRLMIRLLADEQLMKAIQGIYTRNEKVGHDLELKAFIEEQTKWNLWKTGLALYISNVLVLKVWEVPFNDASPYRHQSNKFKLKIDGIWNDVNLQDSSLLEICVPIRSITVLKLTPDSKRVEIILHQNHAAKSQLMALTVEHIDLLLEDWYPSLGTRFVHTSEGRFLITRLVFCPKCSTDLNQCGSRDEKGGLVEAATSALYRYCGRKTNFSPLLNETLANLTRHGLNTSSGCLQDSLNNSDNDLGVSQTNSVNSSSNTAVDELTSQYNPCYTWMVEECILSVYNAANLICPLHSDFNVKDSAPDVIFADIPEKYTINSNSIIKGSLLGRGAFGFVFKASCKVNSSGVMVDVAMKMLQPVAPGPRSRESATLAYNVAVGKWNRDPLQHCCKAYCTARQELVVLLTLKHPNIVPLTGICIKPLALVLELAPLGALDSILRQYRRTGAILGPFVFQLMALQVARAIEYLHRKRIIYRDLKSENVLVWEFPVPHTVDVSNSSVHLKIADYGISRITGPNGSKGFGGTEGFMAPEIVRYNGEEEYTEKVDCFSFGMFLYEIVTLRQPFEGHESVKECVLDGRRPPLSQRETNRPTYCLDLMVLCWDELPKNRPSASQIVSIVSAPEFIRLLDAVVLPDIKYPLCGVFNQKEALYDDLFNCELWLPYNNSDITCLDCNFYRWIKCKNVSYRKLNVVSELEAQADFYCCTIVEKSIWMGDSHGVVHAFRTNDNSHEFSYILDPVVPCRIVFLLHLPKIKRVAVGSDNGRVFLVDSKTAPSNYKCLEGIFVLTEFSSGQSITSACSVWTDEKYELWSSENSGIINIFSIKSSIITAHHIVTHSEQIEQDNAVVFKLYAAERYVFSVLNPGHIVYQWDVNKKKIMNKLDCSKLLPCSESLKSMVFEDRLTESEYQISALAVQKDVLYIGTEWGCLIVADAESLRPFTIFRPYESQISVIIPVCNNTTPLIVTVGRCYRSLTRRFVEGFDHIAPPLLPSAAAVQTTNNGDLCCQDYSKENNNVYCLLWRTHNWT